MFLVLCVTEEFNSGLDVVAGVQLFLKALLGKVNADSWKSLFSPVKEIYCDRF